MRDMLFDRLHSGLGNVLDLRSKQAGITAGNIANTDTPHYRAKFIPFHELLQSAMGNEDMELRQTHGGHLSGFHGTPDDPEIEEMEPPPWAMDDNSVQLEQEMVRLKSNALQYTSVSKGMSKRFAMLKYVASNGRS